jgi:hypothetical protein
MPQAENKSEEVQKVALAILAYFRLHPHAKDTAEGIADWWVREDKRVVKEALDLLVKEQVVATSRDHYFFCDSGSLGNLN